MSASGMPGLRIREATLDDAATLAALLAEMDDDFDGTGALCRARACDAARMREVLADMTAYPDFHAYLVQDDSGTIGTFSLMIFAAPSHHGAKQALLDAVVVTHSRRSGGVGEAMIRRALDLAAAAGCYKMSLSSNLKRGHAHRFYERIGFAQHGISFSILLGTARSAN